MATYKILYWQEIPSQVTVEEDSEDCTVQLADRFQERIDLLAAKRGLQDTDSYLAQWKWSDWEEREGTAQEVAAALVAEMEAQADW